MLNAPLQLEQQSYPYCRLSELNGLQDAAVLSWQQGQVSQRVPCFAG